jgi:hypothetical protein
MKKLVFLAVAVLLHAAGASAELNLYDGRGIWLGVLMDIDSMDGSGRQDQKFHLSRPNNGHVFAIQTFSSETESGLVLSPPGDISQAEGMYFSGAACTGDRYVREYGGMKNALVKFQSRYYKVVGGKAQLGYASWKSWNGPCEDLLGFMPDHLSKVLPIRKPFDFLPARPPFTVTPR